MSERDDGGAVFPFGQVSEVTGRPINGYHNDGMSLRDYFASTSAATRYATDKQESSFTYVEAIRLFGPNYKTSQVWAYLCYEFADAMLQARTRPGQGERGEDA